MAPVLTTQYRFFQKKGRSIKKWTAQIGVIGTLLVQFTTS
jgi:hypothetical protein